VVGSAAKAAEAIANTAAVIAACPKFLPTLDIANLRLNSSISLNMTKNIGIALFVKHSRHSHQSFHIHRKLWGHQSFVGQGDVATDMLNQCRLFQAKPFY
jgi:hypothetical protein